MNNFGADSATPETLRPADRAFLTKAEENARLQIRLAEVGLGRAGSSEIRSHAQQMVGDYRRLNDALEALVRRKGGIAGAPVGTTSENFQKLAENAGFAFDSEFVRKAAQLGDETLTLFEQAAADAKDPDVRDLAAAQLPILRAHRTTLVELKKTWL